MRFILIFLLLSINLFAKPQIKDPLPLKVTLIRKYESQYINNLRYYFIVQTYNGINYLQVSRYNYMHYAAGDPIMRSDYERLVKESDKLNAK